MAVAQSKAGKKKRIKLTEARKRKGYTREELATKVKVSAEHIKSLEYGRVNPSAPLMFIICSELDSTSEELFG